MSKKITKGGICLIEILTHKNELRNFGKELNLDFYYPKTIFEKIITFLDGITSIGFKGKVVQIHECSFNQTTRTSVNHFFNSSPWNEEYMESAMNHYIKNDIQSMTKMYKTPVFYMIDDTINRKNKPSSQAEHPIEATGFHFSHKEHKSVWGHQIVEMNVKCYNSSYPLKQELYVKSKGKSKIEIVKEMIDDIEDFNGKRYILCDSWYTNQDIINKSMSKGLYVIGALKTNRVIYPKGIKISAKEFCKYIMPEDTSLVTAGGKQYKTYRYEGNLKGIENAVVILSWKKEDPIDSKHMKCFLSTDIELSNEEILEYYQNRWEIETYFKEVKTNLYFDKCQIRKEHAIKRYFVIMKLAYIYLKRYKNITITKALKQMQKYKKDNIIDYIYNAAQKGISIEKIKKFLYAA